MIYLIIRENIILFCFFLKHDDDDLKRAQQHDGCFVITPSNQPWDVAITNESLIT